MISIILYRLVGYVINLIQVLQSLISMIASIFKINKLFALNIRKNIVKSINEKYLFNNWKEIRLNNVSYSVSKKIILSNINFKIKSNEITGIIGPSGSGKTSLMLLLTRILNPTCGNILIDQKPIEMFKKMNLILTLDMWVKTYLHLMIMSLIILPYGMIVWMKKDDLIK